MSADRRIQRVAEHLVRYRKSLIAYFRLEGVAPNDVEDVVQGFFESVVCRRDLLANYSNSVRFRYWLVTCAGRYLQDLHRAKQAKKRKPPGKILPIDPGSDAKRPSLEPAAKWGDPEQRIQTQWRRDLLKQAIDATAEACRRKGRTKDFEIFAAYYLTPQTDKPTWKQIAAQFGLNEWKDASRKADWVKRQFTKAIFNEIRRNTDGDDDAADELRDLLG